MMSLNCEDVNGPMLNGENVLKKRYTLALIHKNENVLLGLKKRGFGTGLWNGFGGKVEPDETIQEAAAREIEEECGLIVNPADLELIGCIQFKFDNNPVLMEVHLFKTEVFSGQIHETEEMIPKWYPPTALPLNQMWPDDAIWYPIYLEGRKFNGYFVYEGESTVVSYVVRDLMSGEVIVQKS